MEKWSLKFINQDDYIVFEGLLKSEFQDERKKVFEFSNSERFLEVSIKEKDDRVEIVEKSKELTIYILLGDKKSKLLYHLEGFDTQNILIDRVSYQINDNLMRFQYRMYLENKTNENIVLIERIDNNGKHRVKTKAIDS